MIGLEKFQQNKKGGELQTNFQLVFPKFSKEVKDFPLALLNFDKQKVLRENDEWFYIITETKEEALEACRWCLNNCWTFYYWH